MTTVPKIFTTYRLTAGSAVYYGTTSYPLSRRLSRHLHDARYSLDRLHRVLAATPRSLVSILAVSVHATEAAAERAEGRLVREARAVGLDVLNGHRQGRGRMLPEARARMQHPHAVAQRGPVLDHETKTTYPTAAACARAVGIEPRNLAECLRGGPGCRYTYAGRFERLSPANDNAVEEVA